jgi:hypothetical protein
MMVTDDKKNGDSTAERRGVRFSDPKMLGLLSNLRSAATAGQLRHP